MPRKSISIVYLNSSVRGIAASRTRHLLWTCRIQNATLTVDLPHLEHNFTAVGLPHLERDFYCRPAAPRTRLCGPALSRMRSLLWTCRVQNAIFTVDLPCLERDLYRGPAVPRTRSLLWTCRVQNAIFLWTCRVQNAIFTVDLPCLERDLYCGPAVPRTRYLL